ncbi:hypothetical protein V1511DRAFT_500825 [Dipodascopsis uninucleata]
MATIDYDRLRRLNPGQGGVTTETVAVNHRALITRTLSKYPVDHALFRELIQNSADAGASTVKVEFFTERPLKLDNISDIQKSVAKRLRISNDGMFFRSEDWDRLREIAKGNPDETKIGAFGVGFYSVFAVTDEPMVVSGKTAMNFYYEGDQLHYRRIDLPEESQKEAGKWTSIDLPYSVPKSLPELSNFTSFLAQSLTFVKLQQIEFVVDGITLLTIQKVKSDPSPLEIPREINLKSLDQSMKIERAETESVQIKAKYLNVTQLGKQETENRGMLSIGFKIFQVFTTESEKPNEYTEAQLFLRNITAHIVTSPTQSFAKKLQGAIMKPPPRHASISMIALNKTEADSSQLTSGIATQIFPSSFSDAKVFIGFPTKQTTALKSHIAAPQAIPTMERAAVDTANAYVKDWNKEMMYMAGILARIVYGCELKSVGLLVPKDKTSATMKELYQKAGYTMKQFYFESSTPDPRIGQYIATGFWKSATVIPLMTGQGVLSSKEVRATEDITFLRQVAMVPREMYNEASDFYDQVKSLGMIRDVDVVDVKNEFSSRALDYADTIAFLKWAIKKLKNGTFSQQDIAGMMSYALLADEKMGTVDLRSIRYFHNDRIVPETMPIPFTCLPFKISKELRNSDLEMLGWRSLDIVTWIMHMADPYNSFEVEQNITMSPDFSTEVLIAISGQWRDMSGSMKSSVIQTLSAITCIPTQKGMKYPKESYLHDVKMFSDLPVVNEKLRSHVSDDMLVSLGIRKTVELKYVMERLHSDEAERKWSSSDMITYLAANQKDIRSEDIEFLKVNEIVTRENDTRLHRVMDLYEPTEEHRSLELPLLKWPGEWNRRSPEATFLFRLGLNPYPSVHTLVSLSAQAGTEEYRDKVLKYFLAYFDQNKYRATYNGRIALRFLPATINDRDSKTKRQVILSPTECYSSSAIEVFGFPVLREDLQVEAWKFGVSMYPPINAVIEKLVANPPKTMSDAKKMFSFLSSHLADIRDPEISRLKDARFVPVDLGETGTATKYQSPSRVYIAETGSNNSMFYREFFDFVDFDNSSNAFLRHCGARNRPSVVELAKLTVAEPNSMFIRASTATRYLELLCEFEKYWSDIAKDSRLVEDMKVSEFLIGKRYDDVSSSSTTTKDTESEDDDKADDEEDDGGEISYVLARASNIVINDDVVNFNYFRKEILSAPFDARLERLYELVGSQKMSSVVQERYRIGAEINSSDTESIRKRILERLKLYIDGSQDKLKVGYNAFQKSFQVVSVSKILVERSIIRMRARRITPVTSSISAAVVRDSNKVQVTLCLVPKFEWFDVAQALVKVVLERPTPDAATLLESLMNSSLTSLERRGYNVKRLINNRRQEERAAKLAEQRLLEEAREAAEAKVKAESEQRARMQADLQAQMQNHAQGIKDIQDTQTTVAKDTTVATAEQKPLFDDEETENALGLPPQAESNSSSLLLGDSNRQSQNAQNERFMNMFSRWRSSKKPTTDQSPSSSTIMSQPLASNTRTPGGWDNITAPSSTPSPIPGGSSSVSTTRRINNDGESTTGSLLERGIHNVSPFHSNDLQSGAQTWPSADPQTAAAVASAATSECVCDRSVAHNLRYFGQVRDEGMKVYLDRSLSTLPPSVNSQVKPFCDTLREIATSIFGARSDAFHMFYDVAGDSIAFNLGGSLFFNLRYYVNNMLTSGTRPGGATNSDPAATLDYWFPVVAHELAHNLVEQHGQEHSYFTEAYIQKYAAAYRRLALAHSDTPHTQRRK